MNSVHHIQPQRFRSIWISDTHLGSKECKAEYLLNFLNSTESENLFLLGDIVDIWSYRKNKYWPQLHTDIIRAILDKAQKGTRVVYIPGNHDEMIKDYTGRMFGDVEIMERHIHTTAEGKKLLLIHGDEFDHLIQYSKILCTLGDWSYTGLLKINQVINFLRRKAGISYWSFASYLKKRVKSAREHIERFENIVTAEAQRLQVDGVVCGHIHHMEMHMKNDILYCNDGDWVENCTTLVEHHSGKLEILHYSENTQALKSCHNDIIVEAA